MKCYDCIALELICGNECDGTDAICMAGEPDREFKDGSFGCFRRSIPKLKKDIAAFNKRRAEEMGAMAESFMKEEAGESLI